MELKKPKNEGQYGFEIPQDVLEQIRRNSKKNKLIPEEAVLDLSFVDVTHKRYRFVKRLMDLIIAALAMLICLLPIAIISLIVYCNDPGPVIFSQYRVGLHGKRFKVFKFRTMVQNTPKYLSTKDVKNPRQYITSVGRILRKTSLDELPQLWNVLRGDMSLVGPRPLISDEIDIHQMRARFGVYNVRPGITGLAQINGRDTLDAIDKVHWDVRYLEHFGLKMDLKILAATVPQVFGGHGVVEGYNFDRNRKGDSASAKKKSGAQ